MIMMIIARNPPPTLAINGVMLLGSPKKPLSGWTLALASAEGRWK